jgi:hypothetical protein
MSRKGDCWENAVAYLIFDRPQRTEQTLAVLREYRPTQLFIIADGPSSDKLAGEDGE